MVWSLVRLTFLTGPRPASGSLSASQWAEILDQRPIKNHIRRYSPRPLHIHWNSIISGFEEKELKDKMREAFLSFFEAKGHPRVEPYLL